MELNKIIIGDYQDEEVVIEYKIDLPVTFTDRSFFINRYALDSLLMYLRSENILRIGEWKAFRSNDVKFGHISIDGEYWECMAVYIPSVEHYHIVRTQSRSSKALSVKETLFRFHSGKTIFESIKETYVIRDEVELRNIIKAAGLVGSVLEVKPYAFDKCVEWATYLVTLDGNAIGYTNHSVFIKPVEEN